METSTLITVSILTIVFAVDFIRRWNKFMARRDTRRQTSQAFQAACEYSADLHIAYLRARDAGQAKKAAELKEKKERLHAALKRAMHLDAKPDELQQLIQT